MKTAMVNTTANGQTAEQATTGQGENNNKMEAAIMTAQNHIQGIIQNNKNILVGLVVGGAIAAASLLPGIASADNPARPVGQVESSVFIPASSTANVIDMDFLEPGFYDSKLINTNTGSAMDLDLLDPGVYDVKLARTSSVWESDGVDPYENVEFKSVISTLAAHSTWTCWTQASMRPSWPALPRSGKVTASTLTRTSNSSRSSATLAARWT